MIFDVLVIYTLTNKTALGETESSLECYFTHITKYLNLYIEYHDSLSKMNTFSINSHFQSFYHVDSNQPFLHSQNDFIFQC